MDIGSVVMLKSGGPRMTIRSIQDRSAICNWFKGHQEMAARFLLSQLEVVK